MPKIMAQYPNIENTSSVGSIVLGTSEVQAACQLFGLDPGAGRLGEGGSRSFAVAKLTTTWLLGCLAPLMSKSPGLSFPGNKRPLPPYTTIVAVTQKGRHSSSNFLHMSGCQNHADFLGFWYKTAPSI